MSKKTSSTTSTVKLARPPIVTIMGHVDHGKTTLLDAIRNTSVAAGEAGGITQHIGAYQIEFQGQLITFIDTPGHAAFAKMRERGAQVTDLVILVVAANDGVKPQTVESIKHIKAAAVPLIVAINKIDLPGAAPDTVKGQLTEQQIFVEGYGGQVPVVEVSAKNKLGLDNLLETILLVAELEEIKADPQASLEGVIIESNLDKSRGAVGTLIVKNGTLRAGQTYFLGEEPVKIRNLTDDKGKIVTQAEPGKPVLVLGFKKVPPVGGVVTTTASLPEPVQAPLDAVETPKIEPDVAQGDAEPGEAPEAEEEKPSFNLILKADAAGTLEAIVNTGLHDEITVIHKGVGEINESDVLLAQSTKSLIIGFQVPVNTAAQKLAKIEKVKIFSYSIIYELLEFLEKEVLKILEPSIYEEELGVAQVSQTFTIRGEYIAGCKITSGRIAKNAMAHVLRGDRHIKDIKIKSLKQGKTDVPSVSAPEECGVIAVPEFDFRAGDVLKSYRIVEK